MSSKFSAALRPNPPAVQDSPIAAAEAPKVKSAKALELQISRGNDGKISRRSRLAKYNHADYMSTTIYVHRGRYADVRAALIRERSDFSDLIDSFLIDWLKAKKR